MMKNFILLAFAITIVVASESNPEYEKCKAASVFYVKCNQCRCANDGNGAICTRKQCIPGEYNENGVLIIPAHDITKRSVNNDVIEIAEEPKICEPGKQYKINCNQCICSNVGKLACTRMKCVNAPQKRSIRIDYPDLPESNCEFGKTYRKDCNTCFCGRMGVTACTLMDCSADIVYYSRKSRSVNENWGPRYQEGDVCEPSKKFFSECNECLCSENGRSAVCTLKMCPPRHVE